MQETGINFHFSWLWLTSRHVTVVFFMMPIHLRLSKALDLKIDWGLVPSIFKIFYAFKTIGVRIGNNRIYHGKGKEGIVGAIKMTWFTGPYMYRHNLVCVIYEECEIILKPSFVIYLFKPLFVLFFCCSSNYKHPFWWGMSEPFFSFRGTTSGIVAIILSSFGHPDQPFVSRSWLYFNLSMWCIL